MCCVLATLSRYFEKCKELGCQAWAWLQTDGATNLITVVAIFVAYVTYRTTKRQDRIARDVEMRMAFMQDAAISDIATRIEHSDERLALVLQKLNAAPDPYQPGILLPDELVWHERIDAYLNFLEAVASLWRRGWLRRQDVRGLWSYYFQRIRLFAPLWQYATKPEYEWDDIIWMEARISSRGWWSRVAQILGM